MIKFYFIKTLYQGDIYVIYASTDLTKQKSDKIIKILFVVLSNHQVKLRKKKSKTPVNDKIQCASTETLMICVPDSILIDSIEI